MTREEFTRDWWEYCQQNRKWAKKQELSLDVAHKRWWAKIRLTNYWLLSESGFEQLEQFGFRNQFFRYWPISMPKTGSLILKYTQWRFPWYEGVVKYRGQEHLTGFYILGDAPNTWMTLCNGDILKFLDTWNY